MVLNHPGALRAMFLPGTELGLAEAYLFNDFDIEGDILQVFSLADALSAATSGWKKKLKAVQTLFKLPKPPSWNISAVSCACARGKNCWISAAVGVG
jgi:cyclopropane-fatty-acyl-phospholipid synthase